MEPIIKHFILLALGKEKDQNYHIPAAIAAEFADFYRTNASDTKFALALKGGNGYGTITCTEPSCVVNMVLGPSTRQMDGGIKLGCGSFEVYKAHIAASVAHQASRNERNVRVNTLADRQHLIAASNALLARTDAVNARRGAAIPVASGSGAQPYVRDVKPNAARLSAASQSREIIVISSDEEDVKPMFKRGNLVNPPQHRQPDQKPRVLPAPALNNNNPVPDNPTFVKMWVESQLQDRLEKDLHRKLQRVPGPARGEAYFEAMDKAAKDMAKRNRSSDNLEVQFGHPSAAMRRIAEFRIQNAEAGRDPMYNQRQRQNDNIIAVLQMHVPAVGAFVPDAAKPDVWGLNAAGVPGVVPGVMPGVGRGRVGADDGSGSDNDHPAAVTADLQEFFVSAAEGSDFEGNATVAEAREKLKLQDQHSLIPGMVVSLMPHQFIGVAKMVEYEAESRLCGGILADEMGLGKTVQAIALMCFHKSKDPREKTNLVVAPLALLQQWYNEIEDKCKDRQFKCLIYHGTSKSNFLKQCVAKRRTAEQGFQKYDVVITTYSTLSLEWPDEEMQLKKAKKARAAERKKAGEAAGDPDEEDPEFRPSAEGGLFKMSWYRIILDEAQGIRNRSTRISRAVAQLDSTFRWCMTGTPITNSLGDVFPLLRFCQMKPWFTFSEYSSHVLIYEKKNPAVAGRKCQAILRQCMIRRRKDSTLDGKLLITLPEKKIETRVLEFSPEEREIYTFVEQRTQAKFNKFLKAGTVLKNYAHVLVLLLRLRQLACHPSLITDGYDALQVRQLGQKEYERALLVLGVGPVAKIKAARLDLAVARVRAERDDGNAVDEAEGCPICFEPEGEGEGGGVITKCSHAFCRPCLDAVFAKDLPEPDEDDERGVKYKGEERPCPVCRGPICPITTFALVAFDPTEEEIRKVTGALPDDEAEEDDDAGEVAFKTNVKQKNTRVVMDSDDEEEKEVKMQLDDDKKTIRLKRDSRNDEDDKKPSKKAKKEDSEEDNWMNAQEPSVKMRWFLEEYRRCEKEHPTDKFLVLCSFTSMLDLMDDFLKKQGIRTTRYQGDMTRLQRDESIRVLEKSKGCKVMLMSLKCGGVGLNLVRANRVVSLDLAWSTAVESQAFDRVHRIGQVKEVYVDRLTIENTVEQRISEMQIRKQGLADASMGEGGGAKLGKLSVADVANLFGLRANGQRL